MQSINQLMDRLERLGVCVPVRARIAKALESGRFSEHLSQWLAALTLIEDLLTSLNHRGCEQKREVVSQMSEKALRTTFLIDEFGDSSKWHLFGANFRFNEEIRLVAATHAWVMNFHHAEYRFQTAGLIGEVLSMIPGSSNATISFMEQVVGWQDIEYRTTESVSAINRLGCQFSEIVVAGFLKTLCRHLGLVNRHQEAVHVLETHFELTHDDYGTKAFTARLKEIRNTRRFPSTVNCIRTLADQLRHANRRENALVLQETFAGLTPFPYASAAWADAFKSFEAALDSNACAYYWLTLATQLLSAERKFDAQRLLEHAVGIDRFDYGEPDWENALDRLRDNVATANFRNFVSKLCLVLGLNKQPSKAVVLAEYCAGLKHLAYGSRAWAEALQQFQSKSVRGTTTAYWQCLTEPLHLMDRDRDALMLLEECMGIRGVQYGSMSWKKSIRKFSSEVSTRDGVAFIIPLGDMLNAADRPADAVLLLETFLEVDRLPYASARWVELMNSLSSRSSVDNLVVVARVLYQRLMAVGRIEDAEKTLRYLVQPPDSATHDLFSNVIVDNSLPVLRLWFQQNEIQENDFDSFWDLARKTIHLLRTTFDLDAVRIADRRILIERATQLRTTIVQLAHHWSRQTQKDLQTGISSSAIQNQAILWDLELRQRILSDRLLSQRTPIDVSAPKDFMPASQWPFDEPFGSEAVRVGFSNSSPEVLTILAEASESLAKQLAPDHRSDKHNDVLSEALLLRLTHENDRKLSHRKLAEQLGPDGAMLHVTLSQHGGVRWWLMKAKDELTDFSAVSFFRSDFRAGERLRQLAMIHTIRIYFAYLIADSETIKDCPRQLVEHVRSGSRESIEEWAMDWDDNPHARLVTSALRSDLNEPVPSRSTTHLADAFDADLDFDGSLHERLHDLTNKFAASAAKLLGLESLEAHLNPEQSDLTLLLDGKLQSLPWSIMPVTSNRLCESVRSVRRSLSPEIDSLLQSDENEMAQRIDHPKDILAVSWLGKDGPSSESLERTFHHRVRQTAERAGHHYLGAARTPEPESDWLAYQIQQQHYRVLSVLAHSKPGNDSISLASSKWNGYGQLNRIDWLLLQSCSTGMVKGDLDVEGFCIRLFAYRARAVCAPLWDVNAEGAIEFSDRVLAEYLSASEAAFGSPLPRRAIAVNNVRKKWLSSDKTEIMGGLNTVGAFETFGLG